jgi:pyrroline-5-carboxylate reductase
MATIHRGEYHDQACGAVFMKTPIENVGLIGGGQMGRSLIGGMIAAHLVSPERVRVADPHPEARQWWIQHQPRVAVSLDNAAVAEASDVVLIAVKPQSLEAMAGTLRGHLAGRLVVSVVAGASLAQLQELLGTELVVRVMPNTPAQVRAAASAFCAAASVDESQRSWVQLALQSVGIAECVSESAMDAVTGLSGSGPAYAFVMIEALSDGGVAAGLPRALATRLAAQTLLGAAKMVLETDQHPAVLKDAVASPGGTTIAGLAALEQGGLRAALQEAVLAAAKRSHELGRIETR